MSRGAVCAVLAVATLTVPACGGGSESPKARYEHGFQAVLRRMGAELRSPNGLNVRALRSGGPRMAGLVFGHVRSILRRAAAALSRLHPPAEVRRAHRLFVNGVRATPDVLLRPAFAAFAHGDEQRGEALLESPPTGAALKLTLTMKQARDAFSAKGYHLGSTGEILK